MRLNQTNLRVTLSAILGVDARYVVPRQGNWWSPQGYEPDPARPITWCGYRIDYERTLTVPHYVASPDVKNWSVVHKTAGISLQFVGDLAEDLANSIAHWPHRMDVQDGFAAYDAKVFVDGGAVAVTDFDQQGANTVLAYNVEFRLAWADEIDTGQTRPMENMKFLPGPIAVQ